MSRIVDGSKEILYMEMKEVGPPEDRGSNDDDEDYDAPWKWVKQGSLFITFFAILQYVIFH